MVKLNTKFNKILAVMLSLLIIFAAFGNIIPYVVQAEEADSDVIVISSARELIEFANNCKYDSYSRGRTVRLVTDINLSNTDFKGIPYFDGTFDGANHTIRSFNVDYKGSDYGFFRYLGENAYVCNFSVSGSVNTSGSQKNIGGIAGVNYGTITNCTFYGKVNGTTYVGAIAGINKPGANITNCLSDAVVTATNQTGGIAGKNEGLISECVSRSRVNTDELASSLDVGGVDVGTFNITQHVVDRNDMGGIAGNSSGVISSCTNYGTIGYNHTGYNVGGIAGSQNGKILNCTNEGDIYGRKDVGGIVGQAEPYIESEYLQDRIDTIQGSVNNISNTLNSLSDSMSSASSKTRDYAESITNQYKEDADVLSDSLKEVSDSMQDNPDTREYFDNIDNALNKIKDIQGDDKILSDSQKDAIDEQWDIINDNLKDISNTMADSSDTAEDFVKDVSDQLGTGNITGDIQGIVNVLDEQIQNISDSINTISSQINNIGSTVNDTAQLVTSDDSHIEDISTAENAKNTDGVITKSVNRGTVYGDLNVGGITGTMNIEYDVDPEYDLDLRSSTNVKLRSTVNDIVIYCVNYGEVTSRKDCAGGITGLQELGLIYGCEGYGSVKSETGDYAGGIAGNSVSSVSDNYSLCNVESDSYAGGICGQGYTVKNNVSIATISGDGEKKGVIAGTTDSEGSVRNNIFVSDILGGIDDINYSGIADKVTYDYVMSLDNIPEGFHQITITFKADDYVAGTKVIAYNGNITTSDLPSIPKKDGYYGEWPADITVSPITQNKVVEAEYHLWTESLASNEKNADGKILFLAEGKFYNDDKLVTRTCDISGLSGDVVYAYSWQILSSHTSQQDTVTGHFLVEDSDGSNEIWYVDKDGNNWVKADTKKNGSYITAVIPYEADFALIHKSSNKIIYYIAAATIAIILLATIIIIKHKKAKPTGK